MTAKSKAKVATDAAATADDVEEVQEQTECEKQGNRCTWLIAPPSGPEAPGVCKICGAERTFRNSFEYSSWLGSKNAGGRRPGRPPGRPKKSAASSR